VTGLRRRIEAIAAEVGSEPAPAADLTSDFQALATRLEAAFEERLAAEVTALREDLADALEELSAGLREQMSAIRTEMIAATVYPKSSGWQR
jgi:type VI protein secretion system component VasK